MRITCPMTWKLNVAGDSERPGMEELINYMRKMSKLVMQDRDDDPLQVPNSTVDSKHSDTGFNDHMREDRSTNGQLK